jgi:aryl-alcohol dehydrogenase-like predicted oxidoreductase
MKRREFLKVMAGAAAVSAFPHRLFAGAAARYASDRVKLGPRQVELSRMAIGTGSNGWGGSSNQTRKLGIRGLADLLHAAVDQGVTFWDSADQYGSHPHIREALKAVPREKVTILTKTRATTDKEMRADLDRFRKELGVDHIDILLLHCLTAGDWNTKLRGVMDVISEAQQKGIVRTHGVSCHTIQALKTAAAEPWVEVDLARLNPAQVQMDADQQTVVATLREMKKQGKGVIGMKVLGAGQLRTRQDEALQFALAQDCLDCFTIGIESEAELKDIVRRIPAASTRG